MSFLLLINVIYCCSITLRVLMLLWFCNYFLNRSLKIVKICSKSYVWGTERAWTFHITPINPRMSLLRSRITNNFLLLFTDVFQKKKCYAWLGFGSKQLPSVLERDVLPDLVKLSLDTRHLSKVINQPVWRVVYIFFIIDTVCFFLIFILIFIYFITIIIILFNLNMVFLLFISWAN